MPDTIRGQLTLYVCDSPFPFRDATVDGLGVYWPGLNWDDQAERTLYITREMHDPVRHEPAGQDFSHDADTRGFVSVGEASSGRLAYAGDNRGDTFNLVGLEPNKTYRVEVVFNPPGSLQTFVNRVDPLHFPTLPEEFPFCLWSAP